MSLPDTAEPVVADDVDPAEESARRIRERLRPPGIVVLNAEVVHVRAYTPAYAEEETA